MTKSGKLAIVKLDGDIERQGFRVAVEIGAEGDRPQIEIAGSLPPAPEIVASLDRWQKQYRSLDMPTRIKPKEIIYQGSIDRFESCRQSIEQLRDRLNLWLESDSFRPVDKRLREELNRNEPIRLLIRTSDRQLHRLPWYLWDFIEHYPQAEIALGATEFDGAKPIPKPSKVAKVRILAILGHSKGIDVEADRKVLNSFPDAEVTFLVEPERQQLNDRLWEKPWDILFFAGHSKTEGDRGRIYLNPQESLTIEELQYALQRAIANGLTIAIFNSCDGLGLAQQLERLNLPQIIVMREPVPDQIAQEFVKYFLGAFASGESFYASARQARERLQGWEHRFPCASLLPTIYQNPAVVPPDWQILKGTSETKRPRKQVWRELKLALFIGIITAMVLVGARSLGLLQPWELHAFDRLVQLRPPEESDRRILVITIDEADIQYQIQNGMKLQGSLADEALLQLLQKLSPHQPIAIGSDIIRDLPYQPELASLIRKTPHFIAICRVNNPESNLNSIAPPPDLPVRQIGFTNFALDPDRAIRRQILGMTPDDVCQTDRSFGLQLALLYLKDSSLKLTEEGLWIDKVLFKQLEYNAGGYQLPAKEALGYQILINYRSASPQQVPLQEILNGTLDSQLTEFVKDRIVLIGVAGEQQDLHFTPYTVENSQTPGVIVHAQAISQIISAVADGRSLLWWQPQWIEAIWIGFWSIVGSILVLSLRSPLYRGIAIAIALTILFASCYGILLVGGWIPLVPPALALVLAGTIAIFMTRFQTKKFD